MHTAAPFPKIPILHAAKDQLSFADNDDQYKSRTKFPVFVVQLQCPPAFYDILYTLTPSGHIHMNTNHTRTTIWYQIINDSYFDYRSDTTRRSLQLNSAIGR